MADATTVTADDLDAAVSATAAALGPPTGADWAARAGDLEWDCWHTAGHVGECLVSYAAQLAARPATGWVRFETTTEVGASPVEVLEVALAGGRILAATVRATPPDARAYHPYGTADTEGFAGMGCVEALVHGHDIARGLGLAPLDPPRAVCARVLARMFPGAEPAGADPWAVLLWATGRGELPGRTRVGPWRWRCAPLSEPG